MNVDDAGHWTDIAKRQAVHALLPIVFLISFGMTERGTIGGIANA